MQAVTYQGPDAGEWPRSPSRIEHPNDAIVRVTRAAICGSDLHLYQGLVAYTGRGSTLGHEPTGWPPRWHGGPRAGWPGQRVVVPFTSLLRHLLLCQRGLTASCASTNPSSDLGAGVYNAHPRRLRGCQAQYVRVPCRRRSYAHPDDMTDEEVLS